MKVYCNDCKHHGYIDECDHPENFRWVHYYDKCRGRKKWCPWVQNKDNDCEFFEQKPAPRTSRVMAYLRALFN